MPAWGHLWLGWNEAAIEPLGESCSNTELFRRLAGAMGFTEPALFDDDDTLLAQALGGDGRPRRAAARSAGCACRTPTTAGRSATGVFPTPSGKVELVSDALARDGPAGAADVRRRPARARTATPTLRRRATRCSC